MEISMFFSTSWVHEFTQVALRLQREFPDGTAALYRSLEVIFGGNEIRDPEKLCWKIISKFW